MNKHDQLSMYISQNLVKIYIATGKKKSGRIVNLTIRCDNGGIEVGLYSLNSSDLNTDFKTGIVFWNSRRHGDSNRDKCISNYEQTDKKITQFIELN